MASLPDLVRFEIWRGTTPLFTFTLRDPVTKLPFPLDTPGAELHWIGEVNIADDDVDAQFNKKCDITDALGGVCKAKLTTAMTNFTGTVPLSLTAHLTYTDDNSESHDFLQAEVTINPR